MLYEGTAVAEHMSSPAHVIGADAELTQADALLLEHNISSLAVVESGAPVGVITRTDLLKAGRRNAGARPESKLLELPERSVREEMTEGVRSVPASASAAEAAALMDKHNIHRVFVTEGDRLVGVLSTRDLMVLIRGSKAEQPLSEWMTTPIFTIPADALISTATDRLSEAHVSGLLVVEDGWPIGVFTQREALESQDLRRTKLVDDVMNPALVCLPEETRMHRAAHHATAMRARRIVAVRHREAVGILSGLNFARFVATAS